jgi:putative copper export protein
MIDSIQDWALALSNGAFDLALALLAARLLTPDVPPGGRPWRRLVFAALALLAALAAGTAVVADDSLPWRGNLQLMLTATHSGEMLQLAALGLALVAIDSRRTGRGSAVAWIGTILMLVARASIGHGADLPPLSAAFGMHVIHLAAASVWVGTVLAAACTGRIPTPAEAKRLSLQATMAFAALVISGAANLQRMNAAFGTLSGWSAYNGWLTVKLACATSAALLGLYNRRRHLPSLNGGDADAAAAFLRILRIEAVMLCLLIFAAARLGSTYPGATP